MEPWDRDSKLDEPYSELAILPNAFRGDVVNVLHWLSIDHEIKYTRACSFGIFVIFGNTKHGTRPSNHNYMQMCRQCSNSYFHVLTHAQDYPPCDKKCSIILLTDIHYLSKVVSKHW
jgi:hypothetical protein